MTLQKIVNRLNDLERRLAELESREAAPVYSSLQRDGKVGMSGDQLTPANSARLNYNNFTITEDFTSTTPSGWTWAGSPFVTPATVEIRNYTWLRMSGMSGGARSFFYKTPVPNRLTFAILPVINTDTSTGMYVGIRFDDGTDNNYAEVVMMRSASGTQFRIYYISRIAGGTVTQTEVTNLAVPLFDCWLIHEASGTRWSNWRSYAALSGRNGTWARPNAVGVNMAFTPSRVGIVAKFGNNTWESIGIDATNF